MRKLIAMCLGLLCMASLSACSHSTTPPQGRWEGVYDAGDDMVAARLEITAKGEIFLSAPNAENLASLPPEDRAGVRQHLADGLVQGWDDVKAQPFDFDGKTFRKPGGIAPQAEWDSSAQQMTLVVYLGKGNPIRLPMRAVKDFSTNPFPHS